MHSWKIAVLSVALPRKAEQIGGKSNGFTLGKSMQKARISKCNKGKDQRIYGKVKQDVSFSTGMLEHGN